MFIPLNFDSFCPILFAGESKKQKETNAFCRRVVKVQDGEIIEYSFLNIKGAARLLFGQPHGD